jgi:hypothetical protein
MAVAMKTIIITSLALFLAIGIQILPGENRTDGVEANNFELVQKLETYDAVELTGVKKVPVVCRDYYNLLKQYDWDVNIMLAIMKAESGCDTNRVGDNYPIGGLLAPSCGLLQIRTLAGRPSCEELKRSETNVEWAYRLYKANGYKPWSVYNNGQYTRYL